MRADPALIPSPSPRTGEGIRIQSPSPVLGEGYQLSIASVLISKRIQRSEYFLSDYATANDTSNQANELESEVTSNAVLTSVAADPSQTDGTTNKQPRSPKVWLWDILPVLLLGGGFTGWRLFGSRASPAAAQAPPPTAVKVETISARSLCSGQKSHRFYAR